MYSRLHSVLIEFPPCIFIFRSFSRIEATKSTEEGNGGWFRDDSSRPGRRENELGMGHDDRRAAMMQIDSSQ